MCAFTPRRSQVLGEATELIEPSVMAAKNSNGAPLVSLERKARHVAKQCWQLSALACKLKTLEETVEMARLTGLPLRTIANQAQMVRTENLLLKAARSLGYVLPLSQRRHAMPPAVGWPSSEMPPDIRAYHHWPWPWAELDRDQKTSIEWGIAGHCSRTALGTDGSTGLHSEPVVVLDFASLYPSVFISNNLCFSTLLPPKVHDALDIAHHRTPYTVGPNTRVPGAQSAERNIQGEVQETGGRLWPGSAIAFVDEARHSGLFPRLLSALLRERRVVKRRMKEVAQSDPQLAAVLDARQLTLKLLANASYGFCGADTSHLSCKPLAEACLRFGNYYCRSASQLIEAQGAGWQRGAPGCGDAPRWPGAVVIYANTDSVFVRLPHRSPAEAAELGREMAAVGDGI